MIDTSIAAGPYVKAYGQADDRSGAERLRARCPPAYAAMIDPGPTSMVASNARTAWQLHLREARSWSAAP